jgi:cytochrome c oxidase cbb3-type subunit III
VDVGKRDPVTGRMTTGHEWNGIEELDTPVPRIVLYFLAAGTLFAVIYWLLMPAWPLGTTYTKGLLGIDQRNVVARQLEDATIERSIWAQGVTSGSFAQIMADPVLMANVRETGRTLFLDNCSACHGVNGNGGPGFPDLTAKTWLWGGEPETLFETIKVGINSTNEKTRVSQMLAFGRDGVLDSRQVAEVAAYVRSLSVAPESVADIERASAGQAGLPPTALLVTARTAKASRTSAPPI